ncbi:uroporphyrinogen decarboxylase [Sinimarinibacterium flocculans]|uniref:Uroporphyrinogen decarboxylase n=1 Tax=Sinimarinibacterium flocculans TaxID=985250 RepID=A0A318E744_9GAMM|nr:uroporphyrinogen decarboxylase [Sinimarinibacterium flocculans]PXV64878.1 uroporphyrinogen decarboxylase [Sinimarinibacterium flocculans]
MDNDRFLRALRRQPVDRTPLWMMRQAGRYLPEYKATRARAGDFMSLCRSPELCCEVTLQPLDRFGLDAAILFSDILTVPDAMGLGLRFVEGEGPVFDRPVRDAHAIEALGVPDPETELRYVMDAVRTIRGALGSRLPLIGFAGSPWTLATYMIEGAGGSDFHTIKRMAYDAPEALDSLLAKLAASVSLYLEAQQRAGADALMIFDTWGGVLSPADYVQFSLEPMARIVEHLKRVAPETPVILFTKNGGQHLEAMAETGCDALGLDWTTDLGSARSRVGTRVALQGNLDPTWLLAQPARIEAAVARVLDSYGKGPGHVFNLGHGILQQTPPEHAAAMIEAVRNLSPAFHA